MPFVVSWSDRTFLARFEGVVTAGEIEAVNHLFSGDERMDRVRSSIWDFSAASSVEVPEQDIEYAAAFDKGVSTVKPQLKGALIADRDPVKAKLVAYLSIAKDLDVGWDTRLFDTLEAARAWLEADR